MVQVKRASKAITLVAAGVCGLFSASAVSAADQFWVSLGSYGELVGAEELRDRAGITFSALRVVPADTPAGFVYRVVDGPMKNWAEAKARLDQARVAGFIDAWLLTQDSSVPLGTLGDALGDTPGSSDAADSADDQATENYSETYSYDSSASSESTSDYTASYSADSDQGAPSSDDYDAVAIGTEELVETAPEGYGLHRLERSSQSLAPGAAAESRLSELRTDPK